MLGIILIVLLGFFLYHYRPQKLGRETEFKEALRWSEYGKKFFIVQIIFLIGFQYGSLLIIALNGRLHLWMEFNNLFLYPFSVDFIMNTIPIPTDLFLFVFPLVIAWLTQRKLVTPLSEENDPHQKWFHLIGLFCLMNIAGLFTVHVIEGLVWGTYASFGYGLMLQELLIVPSLFSMLIIGAFAVKKAGHRFNSLPRVPLFRENL